MWVKAIMPPVEVTLSHSFNTLPKSMKLFKKMFDANLDLLSGIEVVYYVFGMQLL